jgi:adenosylhomocysteinase
MYLFERKWADHDLQQRQPVNVEVLPKALDEEVASYMVKGFGGVVTRLTDTQANYLNVKQDGPFKTETYKY